MIAMTIEFCLIVLFLITDIALYAAALYRLGPEYAHEPNPWRWWLKFIPGSGIYLFAAIV